MKLKKKNKKKKKKKLKKKKKNNEINKSEMSIQRGTLLTCEPTIKKLILYKNISENFIIEDIDDTHLLVLNAEHVEPMIHKLIEDHHKNLTFVVEETKVKK